MSALIIEPPHQRRRWVVLDIDGCVIDSSQRLPLLLNGDREGYDALHHTDRAIPHGVALYKALLKVHPCVFVTSRSANARHYTWAQLEAALGCTSSTHHLMMRPLGMDGVPDEILKPQLLIENGYSIEEVLMAVDDRQSMVDHWRSIGVPCIQPVADGGLHVPLGFNTASK